LKEYIVTLKRHEDLDSFYEDMETEGGSLYIPNRKVELVSRRHKSRNTHYYLTKEEAELVSNDPRVWAVELTPEERGIKIEPAWEQYSSNWNKSGALNASNKNWGLLRCSLEDTIAGWGYDLDALTGDFDKIGTVSTLPGYEGEGVDVVILDIGLIHPDHPEFARNIEGTGGSRIVQYNWFQHNPDITGGGAGTYLYPTSNDGTNYDVDSNHACHVGGIAAGNTQGWAKKANVYTLTIRAKGGNPAINSSYIFEYIREFHNNKGTSNPTIVNCSFSYLQTFTATNASTVVTHRGNTYNYPLTQNQLNVLGLVDPDNTGSLSYTTGARITAVEADMEDCVNDGIIFVGSAMNHSFKIDISGGNDYNNKLNDGTSDYYYHRGGTPNSATTSGGDKLCICVGNVSANKLEYLNKSSNKGPRLDICAPGTSITSSFNNFFGYGGVQDTRNPSFYVGSLSGTSMASPQVTGVLACYLQSNPSANLDNCLNWLTSNSKTGKLQDVTPAAGEEYSNLRHLQSTPNRYLYAPFATVRFEQLRGPSGRPVTGVAYPRATGQRTGPIRWPRRTTTSRIR